MPSKNKAEAQHIRKGLAEIGHVLGTTVTQDLIGLVELISNCERYPGIDSSIGSIASITYRLCDAFKTTAALGLGIGSHIDAAGTYPLGLFDEQVNADRKCLAGAIQQLQHLQDSNLVFLCHDVCTLMYHPEIKAVPSVLDTLKLIHDQLEALIAKIDGATLTAEKLYHYKEPCDQRERVSASAAVKKFLTQCMTAAQRYPIDVSEESAVTRGPRAQSKPSVGAAAVITDKPLQPSTHPKHGESGEIVTIKHPTKPSPVEAWSDAQLSAIFVPGGNVPTVLNGVAIHAWHDHPCTVEDWNASDLLLPSLNEPEPPKSALPLASGVVAVEPDGRIWMVSPTNKFGGYETTFPKGKLDHGKLTLQANALKEGYEESGLKVRITGYLGDFKRTTSITRLYLAERVGGDPTEMGWESQAVRLVPKHEWAVHLQNPSDKPVLAALLKHFGEGD